MFSWPATSAIMVPAFGSLVAAALPLLPTLAGLVASADGLVLLNQACCRPPRSWSLFFTFALARPLPPKEMGPILGVAVLLDALVVRLVLLPVALRLTGHLAWWSPAGSSGPSVSPMGEIEHPWIPQGV
ncbi:hypothetical protein [Nocardia testacea]|uniref:hypothetical protein n=1 Tax=Nocardia testacea TaxID=248551 RepID=UPI0002EBC94E